MADDHAFSVCTCDICDRPLEDGRCPAGEAVGAPDRARVEAMEAALRGMVTASRGILWLLEAPEDEMVRTALRRAEDALAGDGRPSC